MAADRGPRKEKRKVFAGRYAYSRPLGRGAGGAVYLCEDLNNDLRQVAVKVLSAEAFATVQGKMLKREFEILSKLEHPNLVAVYDYGVLPDGGVFLAEEYIEGFSLQDARALIPPDGLIDVTMQMLHGLSYLHGMGMIHRDIKPANVMLLWLDDAKARPMVKLVDFGLSSMDPKKDTLRGGTRSYMAPEIIRGEKGELRSDLYSLGVTLYYAMCGVLPFGPRTKSDPPPTDEPFRPPEPHRLNPDVPLNLSRFTMILLRQVEDLEFSDAGEALGHLARDSESLEWMASGPLAQAIDIAAPPVLRGYFERGIVLSEASNRDALVDKLLKDSPTGNLHIVRGGPGAGKSRLAREVAAAVKLGGRVVVEVFCPQDSHPFGLLVQLLHAVLDVASSRELQLSERVRPNVNMLGRLARWIGSDQTDEERDVDFRWIREAFEDISVVLHPERLVVLIEDVQRADVQSLLFLRKWFDMEGAFHRPNVVATLRPGTAASDRLTGCQDAEVIEVPGLQPEDVEYLFETRLGVSGLPATWMQRVATASAGNPAYVEEIARHFIDSGALSLRSAIRWQVDVDALLSFQLPSGMRESFRRRLNAFGKAGRETLELMALMDRPVEWSLLRKLLMARGEREEDADRMIEVLRWRHFVNLDLRVEGRFLKLIAPELKDVILEQMNPEWRRSLHRRIGARLQKHWYRGELGAGEVAHHMQLGGHENVAGMHEIYGDAARVEAPDAVDRAYREAVSKTTGPAKALILTKIAENALVAGEVEVAVESIEEAWTEAERTALEWSMFRVILSGLRIELALGRYGMGYKWLRRLEDFLPVLGQQGGGCIARSRLLIAAGKLDEAERELHAGLAQLEHFGNRASAARARTHLSNVKRWQGKLDDALGLAISARDDALDAQAEDVVGPALLQLGITTRLKGEFEDAQTIFNEAFDHLSARSGVDLCAEVLIELGETHLRCGDLRQARRRGSEALRLAQAFGHSVDELRARVLVAEVDVREVEGVQSALASMSDAVESLHDFEHASLFAVVTRYRYGLALSKSGERRRGQRVEEQARNEAEALGISLIL